MAISGYILCGTPRCGSTLLCDLLAGSGVAGQPNSFYRRESMADFARAWGVPVDDGIDGPAFDAAYLEAALREGKGGTGVFGMRVMWPSVAEASGRLDRLFPGLESDVDRFEWAFGPLRYLFLTRGDKVGQAVSRLRAEQGGLWHRHADGSEREGSERRESLVYDGDRLTHYFDETALHEAAWQDWFSAEGIEPIVITYEALAADPSAALARVLAALGQDPARAGQVALRSARLADAESAAWGDRFVAETWIRLHLLPQESDEKDALFWAWEELDGRVRRNPEDAWRVIELIRRLDGSDTMLSNLGAGPLEDLLVHHGPAVIDRIETAARQDPQFRRLLGIVWRNAIREDVWTRVQAVAGPSW